MLYVADPDVAVAFVPDASGKFLWRCLLRLVMNERGQYALVTYRVYGNGPDTAIFKKLSDVKQIDIHHAVDIRRKTVEDVAWFTSPTTVNNVLLHSPIWTDHQLRISKQCKIQIFACVHPMNRPKPAQAGTAGTLTLNAIKRVRATLLPYHWHVDEGIDFDHYN